MKLSFRLAARRNRLPQSLTIVKLLLALACLAALAKGDNHEREFAKLRSADDLTDGFEPSLQNLRTSDKKFMLGDHCEVSFALADLEITASDHIYKSTACGADFVMVTLNADNMPGTAVRINPVSGEWVELVFLPQVDDELGYMYTTVKSTDVDPEKLLKYALNTDVTTEGRRTKE
jgi:hypothetical protein